jgi:hypothetical protein
MILVRVVVVKQFSIDDTKFWSEILRTSQRKIREIIRSADPILASKKVIVTIYFLLFCRLVYPLPGGGDWSLLEDVLKFKIMFFFFFFHFFFGVGVCARGGIGKSTKNALVAVWWFVLRTKVVT